MASQGRGTEVDLLIIGGGINGAGIARDAAGRGLSVTLCDKADLGGATSAASTKLIHGGLRYLEQWQFRLVRESLRERARLLAIAPHIVWPLRFVLPYDRSQRPSWMIRLGLWLYDHLAERGPIPPSSAVDLGADPAGEPLRTPYDKGFAYWDCWAQDNRLVILNAMDAAVRGAVIRPHTEVTGAVRHDRCWHVQLAGGDAQFGFPEFACFEAVFELPIAVRSSTATILVGGFFRQQVVGDSQSAEHGAFLDLMVLHPLEDVA